jgi:hypothetical protein
MNYTLELTPTVSWTTMEGQTVLFSKQTGDFFGLNETATYLVQELLKSDCEATVREAAAKFGVEESMIRADLDEVVDSLVEAKLATQNRGKH